jgi:hypothetical protein
MGDDIASLLRTTWVEFQENMSNFLPRFVTLLALVLLGWLVAFAVGAATRLFLRWVRFDVLLERVGITPALGRLGGPSPHAMVGSFLFWVVWLSFLLAGLSSLGFDAARQLSADLVRLVPRLGVAILVLVVGYAAANFLWRAVLLWAANARAQQAKPIAGMVRAVTLIAAFAMALEQLGIGERVMHTAFALLMGGIAAGVAIALGFGGRHLARRYLEEKLLARDQDAPREEGGGPHL